MPFPFCKSLRNQDSVPSIEDILANNAHLKIVHSISSIFVVQNLINITKKELNKYNISYSWCNNCSISPVTHLQDWVLSVLAFNNILAHKIFIFFTV